MLFFHIWYSDFYSALVRKSSIYAHSTRMECNSRSQYILSKLKSRSRLYSFRTILSISIDDFFSIEIRDKERCAVLFRARSSVMTCVMCTYNCMYSIAMWIGNQPWHRISVNTRSTVWRCLTSNTFSSITSQLKLNKCLIPILSCSIQWLAITKLYSWMRTVRSCENIEFTKCIWLSKKSSTE